jgi:trans-aconitate 2-methyltransferase
VWRALKPGGRFIAEFGGRGNVGSIRAALTVAAWRCGGTAFASPWYFPGIAEYASLLERGGLEMTFAALIDQRTPLVGEDGLRNWVAMFADQLLLGRSPEQRDQFLCAVEEEARPALYRDGKWVADYRRLRVVAWRLASAKHA